MSDNQFNTELRQYLGLLAGMKGAADETVWVDLLEEVDSACDAFLHGGRDSVVRFSKVQRKGDMLDMLAYSAAEEVRYGAATDIEALAAEVEEKITELIDAGFPVETIETWLQKAVKLSRLKVTADYRILLTDYGKEIKMRQLPKALFLWFLEHPEGCSLKRLQEHRDELLAIYRKLTVSDDQSQVEASIDALVNPVGNSFSEKCAAVKLAFLKEIPERIAKNYYIQGPQGGVKGISLDRDLVEWVSL